MQETLYLTVNLIDRFLAIQPVIRKKLQLVGKVLESIYKEICQSIYFLWSSLEYPCDSVYGLLYKVTEAKRQCIQEEHYRPTKEQIAARCGITFDKLQRLLCLVRMPVSMEQVVG